MVYRDDQPGVLLCSAMTPGLQRYRKWKTYEYVNCHSKIGLSVEQEEEVICKWLMN